MRDPAEGKKQTVPDKYRRIRDQWKRAARSWAAIHYGLGGLAVLLSGLAAASPTLLQGSSLQWITGLAAALMALVTAWAPAKKMKAYNLALNSIESACRRYEYEDPGNDLKHLNDAVDEGEKIIATE